LLNITAVDVFNCCRLGCCNKQPIYGQHELVRQNKFSNMFVH